MRILVDCGVLEEGMEQSESAELLLIFLRGLVRANVRYLRRHPNTPHPYKARIKYIRERDAVPLDELDRVMHERWIGVKEVLKRGGGDCEDLAAYLAAWELVHHGKASILILWRDMPLGRVFHVVTRLASGRVEDPSKRLGMSSRHPDGRMAA